jgi:hypothetical protein
MKHSILIQPTLAIALATLGLSPTLAAEPAPVATPVAQPFYSTNKTDIGTLLDTPATKAVVDMHLQGFSANPQVEMARSLTLKQLQSYVPDTFTDEVLAKIDADLAKITPPK